ncbi:MAG: hypothetical protein ACYC44_02530 [Patescibacteria group bacterium]
MVLFALAMLSTACDGVIVLGDLVSGADAGSDSNSDVIANDVQADADAQGEAEAEAEAQADADAQPEAEAGSKTLLTISFNGPPSSKLLSGQKGASFLDLSYCAGSENLSFGILQYVLGNGFGNLFDPNGKPYFTNIKLVDMATQATIMGPYELDPAGNIWPSQALFFGDDFQLAKETCRLVSFTADLADDFSFCQGCNWRVMLIIPVNANGVVTHDGKVLTSQEIIPTQDIVGNLMTVGGYVDAGSDAQEKFAAYCDILSWDPQNAYMGCCGEFNKVSLGNLKAGDLIKAEGHHTVYFYGSDGKRYVFPTSVEIDSWFSPLDTMSVPLHDFNPNCQKVLEMTDAELVAIPLGSNVTKRPGAYITGLTTDPKRYVVDTHRVLREASPQILDQIYPYPGMVQARTYLTADAFFGNYTIGTPLASADEYIWLQKYPSADLEIELGIKP